MILDTTFLIDVMKRDERVSELVADVSVSGASLVTTTSIMELWEGIHHADSTRNERKRVEELLEDVREVPFDRECAMKAGKVNEALVSAGEPIDVEDVMIGATAIVHDVPVVTRNVSHFDRIDGLDVVSY